MLMEAGLPAEQPRLTRQSGPAPKPGIVHLGLGAFFRAFGAIYIEDAQRKHGGDWGIVGVSLQSSRTRDQLAPQEFVYIAKELGSGDTSLRQVEIVSDVLAAKEDPEAVLSAMTDPATRIVSLTVTEKGYCHDPSTGRLNPKHPDIEADLKNLNPVSAPGYLVRALARRKAAGEPPFTVLSCDNLPDNGKLVRGVVIGLAALIDPDLAAWIEREGRFPSTMVDRIVPATKPEDIDALASETGRFDEAPVFHEPFRQWVIEDDFVPAFGTGRRPDLSAVGVQLVNDVAPYEHMKLRMLNGTHSAIAYLGYLAGHETVADTVADSVFAPFLKAVWRQEIIPSFKAPPGVDLQVYADELLARFANPAIRHRTWQIAMDGSQKLPQRILGTLKDNLSAGRPSQRLVTVVAAWMHYAGGTDLSGRPIDVRDPMVERLRSISENTQDDAERVAAFLDVRDIFHPDLASALKPSVTRVYQDLKVDGVQGVLRSLG